MSGDHIVEVSSKERVQGYQPRPGIAIGRGVDRSVTGEWVPACRQAQICLWPATAADRGAEHLCGHRFGRGHRTNTGEES